MLLGLSGDDVLPEDVYETIKANSIDNSARNSAGRYFKRRPGTEYLYFFNRVCIETDG